MTLLEAILKNNIRLSPDDTEPIFGSDRMLYVDCPLRFATVTFELDATDVLIKAAEKASGYNGSTGMPIYRFYYGVNDIDGGMGDSCITVTSDHSDGTSEVFYIDLTDEERLVVQNCLDKTLRTETGRKLTDFLAEARVVLRKE